MAGRRYTLTFDANLDVTQMKGALNQIQTNLNALHLPQNIAKGLQGSFDNLKKEVQNFEAIMNKDITGKTDFTKLENQANKVATAYEKLKIQIKNLTGLSTRDIEKLFPESISKNINQATTALKNYQTNVAKAKQDVADATAQVTKFQQKIQEVSNKTPLTNEEWKQLKTDIANAEQEVVKYKAALQDAQQRAADVEARTSNYKKSSTWREAQQDIQKYTTALQGAEQELQRLNGVQQNSITYTKQNQQLTDLNAKLTEAKSNYSQLEQALKALESTGNGGGLKTLIDEIGRITGLDMSKFKSDLTGVGDALQTYFNQAANDATNGINNLGNAAKGAEQPIDNLGTKIKETGAQVSAMDSQMREVSALKSRIQYFFGLNNAINLFKNAIRSAVTTVKELDKAMTETAVVTDFTVADMWSQLPEYTQRANELGVTTKAAYEAATLYYQQGLKTQEVTAMSNETLKMARIAGLEAADATDRMTNAIRGFNMEINETNAQRIDDVYSRLAAISASNVDEISTAMTKVASLANNANMEFETTAAFLAQIIETTRESAETAGTALKTVVARFSEVKKLVDEGELRGEDEEGELVDVNKVSQALRTAGIDLNKYFLGEVGLDDIFMELASKWDSLNTVQQRYIATQAAGSRQQSRFIALMSDYARTQELVSEAYNAEGASAEQFAKTQDSLQSKLALLKNAWDRFIMGVTNNEVIKVAVDGLTNLLNIINNLTEAFGEGAGSVLKMATAILALSAARKAFATGGIMDVALSSLTKGGLLGTTLGLSSAGSYVGKHVATAAASTASTSSGLTSAITGSLIGKGLSSIGTTLSGGALAAGSLSAIVTGLGAVAAAAGVTYIAIKKIYDASPEGQLASLEKQEKKLKDIADEANKTSSAISDAFDTYTEKTEAVENASNAEAYAEAIKSRNEYIQSLIEKDSTYAKYVHSMTEEGGQLVLTLDEDALERAVKEAAQVAKEATEEYDTSQIASDIQAITNAQLKKEKTQGIYDWYVQEAGGVDQVAELYGNVLDDLTAEIVKQSGIIQSKTEEMRGEARMLYQSLFDEDIIGVDAKNQFSDAFAEIIEITGALTADQVSEIEGLVGSTGIQSFIDAINNIDTNVVLTNLEDADDMLEALGLTANGDISAFSRLAEILGLDAEQTTKLNKRLKEYAIQQKNQQSVAQQNLQNKFSNFNLTERGQEWLNENDVDIQARVDQFSSSLNGLLNDTGFQNLFENIFNSDDVEREVREAQTFINSLNMDKPIQAYRQLKEAQENSNSQLQRQLAQDIENSNSLIFSKSNLIISVLKSLGTEYDEVQKEVDKLIKKNGELSAKDILDLADSCEDLKALLEEDIVSAETLANVLTGIENGTYAFEDLNDAIINTIENTTTFQNIVENLHNYIEGWEDGIDYGEGIDFFTDRVEDLQELVENFEFGNPKTQKIWNAIFGDDYMSAWNNSEEEMRERIEQFANWIDNDAHGFFTDSKIVEQLGLEVDVDGNVSWPNFETEFFEDWDSVVTAIRNASIAAGNELSDEAIWAILEAWVSHGDIAVTKAANALDVKTVTKSLSETLDLSHIQLITDSQLDLLSEELHVEKESLIEVINSVFKDKIKIVGDPNVEITMGDYIDAIKGQLHAENDNLIQALQNANLTIGGEGTEIPLAINADALDLYLQELGIDDSKLRLQIAQAISEETGTDLSKDVSLPLQVAEALNVEVDSEVVKKIAEAIGNASDSNEIKVTLKQITVTGIENVKTENRQAVANIISEALTAISKGQDIAVAIEDATVKLGEANITPDDPDYLTTLSSILSEYYASSGKAVELTPEKVKAILANVLPELDDKELTTLANNITTSASEQINNLPQGLVLDVNGVKIHVNSVNPPTAAEVKEVMDQTGVQTSYELGNVIFNSVLEATGSVEQAFQVAQQYQQQADKYKITFPAEVMPSEITSETTNEKTVSMGSNFFGGGKSVTGTYTTKEVIKVDADTTNFEDTIKQAAQKAAEGAKVSFSGSLGGLSLEEFKANVESAITEAGLQGKVGIEAALTNDGEGYSIVITSQVEEVDTTQAENSVQESADQVEQQYKEGTKEGLTDGSKEGFSNVTEEGTKTAEQVAEELADQIREGEIEGGEAGAEVVKAALENGLTESEVGQLLYNKLTESGSNASTNVKNALYNLLSSTVFTITVKAEVTGLPDSSGGSSAKGSVVAQGSAAKGGAVKSAASGIQTLSPGPALTGEEAPEIIWNKEKGYAYIVGQNGPEFVDLQEGDRVFNGAETRRILRNSGALGGVVASYAKGRWNPNNDSNHSNTTSNTTSNNSDSSSNTTTTTWRNELDWLYNLMEDIAEYERKQTILQAKYDLALEDLSSTGRDLFKLTQKELSNLKTQLKAQESVYTKRAQQMGELQTQVNAAGYGQYVQWNSKDKTLEINWDAIEAIQDQDTYDAVTEWIERMEAVQEQMDDATEAIWDIKKQIQELQSRYLEQYLDFQDRVMDAVVAQYQSTIDSFSELNDRINDTNSAILDSIQKEIDLERQIRDNTDTEKNIAAMEAKIAYMSRDTTNANEAEIRALQKQLEDAREAYSDTLVDQEVDRLSEANDTAQAQREKQIELMQAQLDYWQESGGLWGEVADLIANGFTPNGSIITGSELWEILKKGEAWDAMSAAQRKNWANELILETNKVGAHLIQISNGGAVNADKVRASIAESTGILTKNISATAEAIRALRSSLKDEMGGTPSHSYTAEKTDTDGYATGGLTSKTGPALLHGTPSEPEYVLNARQTEAFLQLANVLPQIYGGNNLAGNTYSNDATFNINVNVGSIANDYDVDSLVARIKEGLYDAASYRNGNMLGFIR